MQQLSKEKDVKDLDANTKYFHTIASIKRRRKMIAEIKIGRRVIHNLRCINKEARRFYKELYHQPDAPIVDFDEDLVNKLSEEDAAML